MVEYLLAVIALNGSPPSIPGRPEVKRPSTLKPDHLYWIFRS